MKRATFILLSIIMVLAVFAACGEETEFKKEVNKIERGMYDSEVKEILGQPTAVLDSSMNLTFLLYVSNEGESVVITIDYDEEFDIELPDGDVIEGSPRVTKINYRNSEQWKAYSKGEAGQEFLSDFTFYK